MILTTFVQIITLALAASIIAFTYKEFLLPDILHRWAKVGDRYEGRWFYKPVWGCFRCIGGQVALWVYLFTHLAGRYSHGNGAPTHYINFYMYLPAVGPYSFIDHIFAICAAILFTDLLNTFYNKLTN